MKRLLLAIALTLLPFSAMAQSTASQVIPGYLTTVGCPGSYTSCFVPSGATPLAGSQTSVSISSATGLTKPTGATTAVITVEGTNNGSGVCARWRDDGTDPTASAGNPVAAGAVMVYSGAGLAIKFIQATGATCTMDVSYYK